MQQKRRVAEVQREKSRAAAQATSSPNAPGESLPCSTPQLCCINPDRSTLSTTQPSRYHLPTDPLAHHQESSKVGCIISALATDFGPYARGIRSRGLVVLADHSD